MHSVGEVLPYLNAVLGGFEYTEDCRPVTLENRRKLGEYMVQFRLEGGG